MILLLLVVAFFSWLSLSAVNSGKTTEKTNAKKSTSLFKVTQMALELTDHLVSDSHALCDLTKFFTGGGVACFSN